MSSVCFAKSLARVLVYEGGKVDDPQDPGGRTNKGITQATFDAYIREQGLDDCDVYSITNAEVAAIYKTKYWDAVKGDAMPAGLDFCIFDAAVNSGVGRAGKWLQQSLGDHYQGQVDGLIGMKTVQAVADYGDPEALIQEYCARRLGTLKRLSTFRRFGKGWSARIANVQKTADAWAANDVGSAPLGVMVSSAGGHQKAQVDDNLMPPSISPIVTHVVAGAGSVGTIASSTAQQITAVADTFGWVKYLFGGLTLAAVVAGVVVKFGADATKAAEAGKASQTVNLDADAGFQTVADAPIAVPVPSPIPAPAAPAAT